MPQIARNLEGDCGGWDLKGVVPRLIVRDVIRGLRMGETSEISLYLKCLTQFTEDLRALVNRGELVPVADDQQVEVAVPEGIRAEVG
jgi:hypothetical protein